MESKPTARQKLAKWRSSDPQLSLLGSLGTVADVLAIVGAISWVIALVTRRDLPKSLLAIFLGILTLACVVMVFRLQNTLRELQIGLTGRARVGDALPSLAESMADLSRATVAISDGASGSETVFFTHLEAACRSFAEALRTATGSHCRVTVQDLYAPDSQLPRLGHSGEDFAVRTIARSGSSTEGPALAAGGVDWVRENTDFEAVLLQKQPYYLCNDLVAELSAGYRNSHWPPERLKEMQVSQNYPYRSTIVWPLRGRITGPGPDNQWVILGFLSVDSPNTATFDASSVPLGETFAHALYAGLNMYENRQLEAGK